MDEDIWSNSIQLIMTLLTLSMQIKEVAHQIFLFHEAIGSLELKLTMVEAVKEQQHSLISKSMKKKKMKLFFQVVVVIAKSESYYPAIAIPDISGILEQLPAILLEEVIKPEVQAKLSTLSFCEQYTAARVDDVWQNVTHPGVINQVYRQFTQDQFFNLRVLSAKCESLRQDSGDLYLVTDIFAPHNQDNISIQQSNTMHLSQSLQKQPSQIRSNERHSSIKDNMKEQFQFILELLPDNTYQIRQKKGKHSETSLLLSEFYQLIFPSHTRVSLSYLKPADYKKKITTQALLTQTLFDLAEFDQLLRNKMNDKQQADTNPHHVVLPYTFDENEKLLFRWELFSHYTVMMLR